MSGDETQSAISRAFELVEAGRQQEAQVLLEPLLAQQQNNADLWWVYAHAVTDPEKGRDALNNVLRIDPNYPGAAELLAIVRQRYPETAAPAARTVAPPPSLPEDDFPEPIPSPVGTTATQESAAVPRAEPQRRSIVPLIALAAIIVLVLVALVVFTQGGATPAATETPTAVVEVIATPGEGVVEAPTEVATEAVAAPSATEDAEVPTRRATVTPTFTLEPGATAEATAQTVVDDAYATIYEALSNYALVENGIQEAPTTVGDTLVVSVCSAPGREMRTLLPQVMDDFARQSDSLTGAVDGIGVRMINCDANTALLSVAVDLASAQQYAAGSLTDSEFAALWQAQPV